MIILPLVLYKMNKNHIEQSKLSNRNTKSSLNFINNILIEAPSKSIKPKINYSKIVKPSFTRVANYLCRNESKSSSFSHSDSTVNFQLSLTQIIEKLKKMN